MSIWTLCDFCSPTKTGVPGDIPTFPMVPDVTDFLFRLRFSIFFSTSSPPSRLPAAIPYMYDSICAGSSLGTCENGEIIRGLRAKWSRSGRRIARQQTKGKGPVCQPTNVLRLRKRKSNKGGNDRRQGWVLHPLGLEQ